MRADDRRHMDANLLEHAGLQSRTAVGQEDVRAVAKTLGQIRLKRAKDVEVNLQGVAGIHVLVVASLPAEGLPGQGHQPGGVDATVCKHAAMLVGKVLAHGSNETRSQKEACRIGEIRRRATQRVSH